MVEQLPGYLLSKVIDVVFAEIEILAENEY